MKFAIVAVAFATTVIAVATPQNFGQACDSDQNGCYAHQCTCDSYNYQTGQYEQDDSLGTRACNLLHQSYPNLYFKIGSGCVDRDQRGVEPNGFNNACQQVAGPGAYTRPNCLY
ncbi:hypothetical protein Slin15195_G021860 [Septoria linicola]|uniref:Uncharacterized protein n=1 Tax=Septoria linicola TaxID=215465 RepID=A0A9Q9AMR4_9PEZI|nr:hypothetical protein Slin14017_G130320 [Septoria linicola]USW48867.1 hypothetical protein Slin15195_G021860 [Septoria linicola]